jgi:hypothetical protein
MTDQGLQIGGGRHEGPHFDGVMSLGAGHSEIVSWKRRPVSSVTSSIGRSPLAMTCVST